jgi:hypothetical protein
MALNGIDPTQVQMPLRPSSLLAIPARLDRWYPIASALTVQAIQRWPALLAGVVLSMVTARLVPSLRRALLFLWVALLLYLVVVVATYFSVDLALQW